MTYHSPKYYAELRKIRKQTSEQASKQGNKLGIKRFASQQALNVIPIIRSERLGRLIVCKQFGERAASV